MYARAVHGNYILDTVDVGWGNRKLEWCPHNVSLGAWRGTSMIQALEESLFITSVTSI